MKQDEAMAIRDSVLGWLRTNGTAEKVSGITVTSGQIGDGMEPQFQFMYRPPFGPLRLPRVGIYSHALLQQRGVRMNLEYALDVWAWRGGKFGKMMFIKWSASGSVDVVTFRRGPWEGELLALLAG